MHAAADQSMKNSQHATNAGVLPRRAHDLVEMHVRREARHGNKLAAAALHELRAQVATANTTVIRLHACCT